MLKVGRLGPGIRLGKYLIRRELGRGGMGAVFLAEDTLLGREVAIKVLLPALCADPEFTARFREEARAVAKLQHPNIVHVNCLDWVDDQLIIDMEYVDGASLDSHIHGEGLARSTALGIVTDVLKGLQICHDLGIVHRDIKPSNVLVEPTMRAKLGDFGIAKAYALQATANMERTESSTFILGTPHYAPPELWEGETATPAWDVYSVGVMVYQVLSGKLPYDGSTPFAVIKQIQNRAAAPVRELVPDLSPELAAWVDGMLRFDAGQRPSDAGAALSQLCDVPEIAEAGLRDSSTVKLVRCPRKSKRAIKRAAVAAAIGIAAMVAVVALTVVGVDLYTGGRTPVRSSVPSSQLAPKPVLPAPQEVAARSKLLSKAELLERRRNAGQQEYLMFDATALESPSTPPVLWMVEKAQEGTPSRVIAFSDRTLWQLRMQSLGGGRLSFDGEWAVFHDDAGTSFRQGTMTGSGLWTDADRTFTVSFDFVDASNFSQYERTFVVSHHARFATDTAFLVALEEAPLVQLLLYHELLPRASRWAREVESMLPAVSGARLNMPLIAGDSTPPVVDGRVDEAFWSRTDGLGVAPGLPLARGAKMLARCTRGGIYLGFRIPLSSGPVTTVEVAWMEDVAIPVERSSYVIVRQPCDGPRTTLRVLGQRELAWDCNWQSAAVRDGDAWEGEFFIPFETPLDTVEGTTPLPGRLNCAAVDDRQPDAPRVYVRWGFAETREVLHGMKPVVVHAES